MFMFMKRFKIKRLTKKINALQSVRAHAPAKPDDIKKELRYYRELMLIYKKLFKNKRVPFAKLAYLECLRQASELEDALSSFELGQLLLEEAKFRTSIQSDGALASTINEKKASQLYEEAHAYLSNAEQLGSSKAKRLKGLCFINGWGVDPDQSKGFELIVASINDENAWDKVPQIFAEIGLNKPEFFQALNKHRK